jgi:signal transduction histidine kinase
MNTILIVDDSLPTLEALCSILDDQGYNLVVAHNGAEALEQAMAIYPDVILLDVMMPGMDGFEVCRRIRSTSKLAEMPIVMLTALNDSDSLLQGIEAGADDFLAKPVDRHELRARVRTITRLNRYRNLMEQREALRIMADRIITAQEQERQRISRELHDDLGQSLTTQMLDIRSLQEDISTSDTALFKRLQAIYQQSYEISVKVRGIAQDMRPPVLDALELKDAMQMHCEEITRRSNIPIDFEADSSLPQMPDSYNLTLYRVLQEALNNVVKHSKATHSWVDLTLENKTISLTVQDNGCGFVDKGQSQMGGIGLAGLRERLTIAGGIFKIDSNSKRGTILVAQLPLPEDPQTTEAK